MSIDGFSVTVWLTKRCNFGLLVVFGGHSP